MERENYSEMREVLESFSRALSQEAHNLRERPDILWQEMFNRLQWADGEDKNGPVTKVLEPQFKKRSQPGSHLWLHLLNHPMESSESLIRTLKGHTGSVYSCAFSPDGKLLTSTSSDNTIKILISASLDCSLILWI
jgi:WD40 repeat protein